MKTIPGVHGQQIEAVRQFEDRVVVIFKDGGSMDIVVPQLGETAQGVTVTSSKLISPEGYRLCCYAPGDGALSFAWSDGGTVASRQVTEEDARNYLASYQGENYRERGYKVETINGQVRLVAHILRVNSTTLSYEGKRYKVELDPVVKDCNHIPDSMMKVTSYIPDINDYVNVANISTRAALRFFLSRELGKS